MKQKILYYSFVILTFFILPYSIQGQYVVKSVSKEELGIPTIKVFKKFLLPKHLTIYTNHLHEREKYLNFYEADSTMYYYYNDTLYDILNNKKIKVLDRGEFLYRFEVADTIIQYLRNLKFTIFPNYLHYLLDSKNRLWIYPKNYDILFLIQNNEVQKITKESGLLSDLIFDIKEDPNGRIWLANGKGISCYTNGSVKNYSKTLKNKRIGKVKLIQPLVNDKLFFLTNNGKLGFISEGEVRILKLANKHITDIMAMDSTAIWLSFNTNELYKITADGEIYIFKGPQNEFIGKLYAVHKDSKGIIWIFSRNRLIRIFPESDNLKTKQFNGKGYNGYYQDRANIWFFSCFNTVCYNYNTDYTFDINDEFNKNSGISNPAKDLYSKSSSLGVNGTDWYFNSGILVNNPDIKIYIQYGVNKSVIYTPVVSIEEIKEYPLIILFIRGKSYNLTDELKLKDNRPLGGFIDSKGNFWIDTPSSIHKVTVLD